MVPDAKQKEKPVLGRKTIDRFRSLLHLLSLLDEIGGTTQQRLTSRRGCKGSEASCVKVRHAWFSVSAWSESQEARVPKPTQIRLTTPGCFPVEKGQGAVLLGIMEGNTLL